MKKKIYILVLFILMFFIVDSVKAESFYEGNYFNVYVNKKKDNKTYYLTMQTIRDRDNNNKIVYCLEPFKFFDSNSTYNKINSSDYYLSKEQMVLIKKLTYYGYGYGPRNRNTYEWYAITQVLIWRVVDPSADIYFTNGLNGSRDDVTYQSKIDELLRDVNNNSLMLNIDKDYKVIYNNDFQLDLNNYYEIVDSSYDYTYDNNKIIINNIKKDGYITIREKANNMYKDKDIVYDSPDAQDLYLPGSLEDKEFRINIDVIMGDITLNIFKDKETYSVDADFTNTCYGIYKDNQMIQKVCANDEYKYKTGELEVGDYQIKQLSNGEGYIEDSNIYNVSINEYNLHPVVNLYNYIKSNDVSITKRYCDEDRCSLESKALFEVYDSKSNLIKQYETDNNGYLNFRLGYGKYDIIQVEGKDGYKLANNFTVFIDDVKEVLSYELYDRKEEENKRIVIEDEEEKEENEIIKENEEEIDVEEEVEEEIIEEEIKEEESYDITPPDTGIILVYKNNKWIKVFFNYLVDVIRKYGRYAILL